MATQSPSEPAAAVPGNHDATLRQRWRRGPASWVLLLTNAPLYFAGAKLGLSMAFLARQVSPVWPPTGIALAAVLLFGPRVWPAIALGALLANATAHEPLPTAAGIALGNTLEALIAGWLLQLGRPFRTALDGMRDVLGLIGLAAGAATTIAATIGVASLCLGGVEPWSRYATLWGVWWLGDAMGALVVAPVLLCAFSPARPRWPPERSAELCAIIGVLVALCALVFSQGPISPLVPGPALDYAVFPFLVWAAMRGGPRGATLVAFAASAVAIAGTLRGYGPFAGPSSHEGLVLLQAYLGVLAVTGLLLAAAIAERDRAERRRTDAARDSEQRLRAEATFREAVEQSIPAGIAAIDPQGRQTYVNPAFARQVGWSGEELIGARPPFAYWPPEEHETIQQAFAATIAGEAPPGGFTLRFQRRDGERFDALVHLSPLIDGQGVCTGWLAAVSDITEQKRTEKALRQSEERYRSLVLASAQVVWITDPVGDVVEELPTWREFTGQESSETLGRGWMERLHPDDRGVVAEVWARSLATGTPHVQEMRVRARDGNWRDVRSRAVPVKGGDGRIREWVGTLTDITERKALEQELRRRADELAEADQRKDEFLAMLGHELRNPLGAVSNAMQVLRAGGGSGNGTRMLDVIDRQVRLLRRLVDDLLEVSRITRGEISLRAEPLDLRAVVVRAVETAQPWIDERRHHITLERPPEPMTLAGDPMRLEQVFANLLHNAAKYTEPGGHIGVKLERQGEAAVVRVNDDGLGIPPELLPHIFELFTQGDRSLDRARGGLGIGLTLVQRIIELHGGTIAAHSAGAGRGSEFVVRLPAHPPASAETAAPPMMRTFEPAVPGRPHVLIVEDQPDAAESLAELVRLQGCSTEIALDGPAALERAASRRPDVVLLDLGLPGVDGFEVALRLRRLPGLADSLLVALSGYGREEDRRRSAAAGIDRHLVKPVDIEELERLLGGTEGAGATRSG
jgi:two-component system CheB/CheR fusion protein